MTRYLLANLEKAVQNLIDDWGTPKGELSDVLVAITGHADGKVNPPHPGSYLYYDAGDFPKGPFKSISWMLKEDGWMDGGRPS